MSIEDKFPVKLVFKKQSKTNWIANCNGAKLLCSYLGLKVSENVKLVNQSLQLKKGEMYVYWGTTHGYIETFDKSYYLNSSVNCPDAKVGQEIEFKIVKTCNVK